MTKREIQLAWEKADRMAEAIWAAYVLGVGVETAKTYQKSLGVWLNIVRENGYVYNGALDEYVTLPLK